MKYRIEFRNLTTRSEYVAEFDDSHALFEVQGALIATHNLDNGESFPHFRRYTNDAGNLQMDISHHGHED